MILIKTWRYPLLSSISTRKRKSSQPLDSSSSKSRLLNRMMKTTPYFQTPYTHNKTSIPVSFLKTLLNNNNSLMPYSNNSNINSNWSIGNNICNFNISQFQQTIQLIISKPWSKWSCSSNNNNFCFSNN